MKIKLIYKELRIVPGYYYCKDQVLKNHVKWIFQEITTVLHMDLCTVGEFIRVVLHFGVRFLI